MYICVHGNGYVLHVAVYDTYLYYYIFMQNITQGGVGGQRAALLFFLAF